MRHAKGRGRLFAALAVALTLLIQGTAAMAAGIDYAALGSLTIVNTAHESGKPLAGVEIEIFPVAEITTASPAVYRLTADFVGSGVVIGGGLSTEEQTARAKALSEYADASAIAPLKSAKTDSAGRAAFGNLHVGLYLARVGAGVVDGFDPFLVSIPTGGENGVDWDYCVVASPKSGEPRPTPTPSPSPTPTTTGKIPQTGLDYTGVYLLLGVGALLVVAGCVLVVAGRKRGKQ